MSVITIPFVLLCISTASILILLLYILSKRPFTQFQTSFLGMLSCVFIICVGVLIQEIVCNNFTIDPIYFEYFIYIGTCFLPVCMFFTAIIFKNTKIKFEKRYLLLFIIPILSLFILWTNQWHHLFFVNYSSNIAEGVVGSYFNIHSVYTYALLFISMFIMIQTSLKTSGIFSRQSILVVLGTIIPVGINFLGTTKIFDMSVYLTPISFSVAMLCYAFAMLKFDLLNVSPIALQKIVNVMSDSYLVLDVDERIIDYNNTFVETFNMKNKSIRQIKIFDLFGKAQNIKNFKEAFDHSMELKRTCSIQFAILDKHFNIEISPLFNKKVFIGSLVLFKNVTQHFVDMQKLKDNQETLMESERLASLGQLIGGIAHNLKTPIMSIGGAVQGITDLIQEYDASIDDPSVNSQDHHDIAKDMITWTKKIKDYTEYMSDVITAVKGQAVVMSEADNVIFDVEELVKRIDILMKHELKSAIVYLNVSIQVPPGTQLHGDINSLVQVINNMISNSIQSYNGVPEQKIDLNITKDTARTFGYFC